MKWNLNKEKSILAHIFTIIFLFVFTIVFIANLFFNNNDLVHYRMIRSFYFGATILGILLLAFYIKSLLKDRLKFLNKKSTYIFIALIVFILQILLAKSIYFKIGWDVSAIIKNADFLVNNITSFEHNYFLMYPNNLFLLFVFAAICKISELIRGIDYEFLLVVVNIIAVDLAILMTILSAKKIFNKKSVIVTMVLFCLLFAFSPWIIVPYSDTLSMFFPITIFYLYLVLKDLNKIEKSSNIVIKKKINKELLKTGNIYVKRTIRAKRAKSKSNRKKLKQGSVLALMGLLATIGFQIKPTIIIVLIAILIAEFISSVRSFKKIVTYVVAVAVVCVFFISSKTIYDNKIKNIVINGYDMSDNEDLVFPFTHFAMMGMQKVYIEDRGTIYGAYAPEDVLYTESFVGKDAKSKANIEEIKRRLKNFGPMGYLEFLVGKGLWVLSDGSFYYGGEGNFMLSEPYSKGKIAKELQNIFLHTGEKFYGLVHIYQGIWILIIFLIMYPIIDKKRLSYDNNIFVIRLAITGIVMFLVLFEARSRYLINSIPFFILLASYGFDLVYERFLKEIKD